VCALFWGLSFLGTSVSLKKLDVIQLLALRWTIATALFLVLSLFRVVKIRFRGKRLRWLLLTGALQPCIYSIFETLGVKLTTASESSIFIATIPLMVLLIGRLFLHQKASLRTAFAIVLAFGGVVVCVAFSPEVSFGSKGMGYVYLLCAVIVGAAYSYACSKAAEDFDSIEITCGISIMGCLFYNVIGLVMGYGFSGYAACIGDSSLLLSVLFLGVCCSCLCYLIFNYVLSKLPTAIATNLVSNSVTAVGVLSGCLLGGDPFGWYTIVGVIMTILGVCLASGASKDIPENS
jgi:drug/metabolite transporter (DMT)-like permease